MSENKKPVTVTPATAIGLLVTFIWAVMVFLFFSFSGLPISDAFGTPLVGIVTLLSVVLPVALIWTAALTAGTAHKLKQEAKLLRSDMERMTTSLHETTRKLPQEQSQILQQLKLIAEMTMQNDKRLKLISEGTAPKLDVVDMNKTVFGTFQTYEAETQISLNLDSSSDQKQLAPMPAADFIAALNFPNDAKDKDGYRALRRAMEDRKLRAMLDSVQRVMSMLTEDGIFMDDLTPDRPAPTAWREFAKGARGKDLTTVGGIHDKAVLAIARARMKSDPDFRESVHYFMRQFDQVLVEYEPRLQNHDLSDFADTRSARCFMVMARVSGAFD